MFVTTRTDRPLPGSLVSSSRSVCVVTAKDGVIHRRSRVGRRLVRIRGAGSARGARSSEIQVECGRMEGVGKALALLQGAPPFLGTRSLGTDSGGASGHPSFC